jgi:hypothetical protein
VSRKGGLVSRDEIADKLWGSVVYIDTNTAITVAVRKVRLALRDDSESPRCIQTVPGKGYRFVGSAVEEQAHPYTPAATETKSALPVESPPVLLQAARYRGRFRGWMAIAEVCVVALIAGGLYSKPRPVKALTENDVIVLADFTNTTGNTVFDNSLKTALFVVLNQSPYLNVLPEKSAAATSHHEPNCTHQFLLAQFVFIGEAGKWCSKTWQTVLLREGVLRKGCVYVFRQSQVTA